MANQLEAEDIESTERLHHILIDRITFITQHGEVIKLILMECQINPEIIGSDYVDGTLSLLKKLLKN